MSPAGPPAKGRPWLAVLAAALALRAGLWLNLAPHPAALQRPDSASYLKPASNLAAHGRFSSSDGPPWAPESLRPPGYPAFLAAHLLLCADVRFPSATQVALDSGAAALAAAAAAGLSSHPLAWAAGLLYGLDLVAAAHAPLILSEALFIFLLTLSAFLLLRAEHGAGRPRLVWLAGLCLGAAVWVRPVALHLWLPWAAALAWAWPPKARRLALAFAVSAALLPAAWCQRNAAIWGGFSFNPVRGADALMWEAASVQAAVDGTSVDEARVRLRSEFLRRHPDPFGEPMDEAAALQAFGREVVLAHPVVVAKMVPVSALKMMLGPGMDVLAETLWPGEPVPDGQSPAYALAGTGTLAVLKTRPALWLALAWDTLLLAVLYGLAGLGVLRLRREKRRWPLAVLLVPCVYLLAISAGGWAYYRLRLPMLPLLAMLAACGLPPRGAPPRGLRG